MKRLVFLDYARAFAAVFMVFVHVVGLLSLPRVEESMLGVAINFGGSLPAAPIFMFAMGVSFALKPNQGHSLRVRRAFSLLGLGYLLNALRLIFPFLLVSLLPQIGWVQPHLDGDSWWIKGLIDNLLVVDILQLAGVSYLFLTLLSYFRMEQTNFLLLIVVVVVWVSPYLWGIKTHNILIDRGLDLLWGNNGELVSFPFFPWVAFPVLGFACGIRYRETTKPIAILLRKDLLAGVLLFAIGALITIRDVSFHLGDYWRTGPGGMIMYLGFIPMWIYFCYATSKLSSKILLEFSRFISKNITVFYFIQWILISSLVGVLGEKKCDYYLTVFFMIILLVTTICLTFVFTKKDRIILCMKRMFT